MKLKENEAKMVCYQAYAAIGGLLEELGIFDCEKSQKLLTNLSEARLVHDDVLPFDVKTEVTHVNSRSGKTGSISVKNTV